MALATVWVTSRHSMTWTAATEANVFPRWLFLQMCKIRPIHNPSCSPIYYSLLGWCGRVGWNLFLSRVARLTFCARMDYRSIGAEYWFCPGNLTIQFEREILVYSASSLLERNETTQSCKVYNYCGVYFSNTFTYSNHINKTEGHLRLSKEILDL